VKRLADGLAWKTIDHIQADPDRLMPHMIGRLNRDD
jgi:hypothetical protein